MLLCYHEMVTFSTNSKHHQVAIEEMKVLL